jgi:hypothetical protein
MVGQQCPNCKHLSEGENLSCDAFPAGIPQEILTGEFDHTNEYPGDNGIRFEPIDED